MSSRRRPAGSTTHESEAYLEGPPCIYPNWPLYIPQSSLHIINSLLHTVELKSKQELQGSQLRRPGQSHEVKPTPGSPSFPLELAQVPEGPDENSPGRAKRCPGNAIHNLPCAPEGRCDPHVRAQNRFMRLPSIEDASRRKTKNSCR